MDNLEGNFKTLQANLKGNDILSIHDLSKEEIRLLLDLSRKFKNRSPSPSLSGKILASCFFEPSTRTQLSFASAMKRLGGEVIGFSDANVTSVKKGESLTDMMKVIGSYADVVVIRHPLEGAARVAADATSTPVINAGDGANEHPTQTFIDLFSIEESQGSLEKLDIVLLGDLKYSRTAHSLALALRYYNVRLYFVSPPLLAMPQAILETLRASGIPYSFQENLDEVIDKADILYVTRLQEERFFDKSEFEVLKNSFSCTLESLKNGKKNLKILHPLPRRDEISLEVDESPFAYYFQQAQNGLYVRMALLNMVLS